MNDAAHSKETEALISAHLDNELDDAGHQALETWLSADRAPRLAALLTELSWRCASCYRCDGLRASDQREAWHVLPQSLCHRP